jgi:N-acetylmuramoyl-L-alanine amidase
LQRFAKNRRMDKLPLMRTRISSFLLVAVAALLLAPAAASAYFAHTVSSGESLYSVAAVDGLSVAQLAAANGLSTQSQLIAGSTLMIPPQGVGSSAVASSPSSTSSSTSSSSGATPVASGSSYLVRPGDTLSGIAAREGTTVAALAAANGLDPNGILLSGKAIVLSGSGSSSSGSAVSQPVGSTAEGSSSAPPYPTPERVSGSEVAQIAEANGVSPSLAEAIGWQESGFNNDLVSGADARGVMQILPGTWSWIQHDLNTGTPLAPASAADNVRGGVLMLRSLLNSTGGDPAQAAAGYYQGLPSVQAHGLYSDTQQYVNSVMALRERFLRGAG